MDYAEVADATRWRLWTISRPGRRAVALVAARVGTTRLIDNAMLQE